MNWEMLAAIGAIVAALAAAVTVCLTWIIRRENKLFRIRDAISAVIAAIDKSMVYKIPPHNERWTDGFKSLDETRHVLANSKQALIASGASNTEAYTHIENIEKAHQQFVPLRDSLWDYLEKNQTTFSHGWPELSTAESQLSHLQKDAKNTADKLNRILGGMSV